MAGTLVTRLIKRRRLLPEPQSRLCYLLHHKEQTPLPIHSQRFIRRSKRKLLPS